jgi:hypothetical protein
MFKGALQQSSQYEPGENDEREIAERRDVAQSDVFRTERSVAGSGVSRKIVQ